MTPSHPGRVWENELKRGAEEQGTQPSILLDEKIKKKRSRRSRQKNPPHTTGFKWGQGKPRVDEKQTSLSPSPLEFWVRLSVSTRQAIPELQRQTPVKRSSKRGRYWSSLSLLGNYWAENIQCAADGCILSKLHTAACSSSLRSLLQEAWKVFPCDGFSWGVILKRHILFGFCLVRPHVSVGEDRWLTLMRERERESLFAICHFTPEFGLWGNWTCVGSSGGRKWAGGSENLHSRHGRRSAGQSFRE